MQNKATWLESTPTGFKVRVQFMPINAAEHDRCSRMLKNLSVVPVMVTTEGPMTVDLIFTDSPLGKMSPVEISEDPAKAIQAGREEPAVPLPAPGLAISGPADNTELKPMPPLKQVQGIAQGPGNPAAENQAQSTAENELTNEQKAALNKPDPTDKPA